MILSFPLFEVIMFSNNGFGNTEKTISTDVDTMCKDTKKYEIPCRILKKINLLYIINTEIVVFLHICNTMIARCHRLS